MVPVNQKQEKNSHRVKYEGIVERVLDVLAVKSQKEIAQKLGITDPSVSEWKKRGVISIDNLVRITELTNASIYWILTGKGPKYLTGAESIILNLSSIEKEAIKKLAATRNRSFEQEVHELIEKALMLEGLVIEQIAGFSLLKDVQQSFKAGHYRQGVVILGVVLENIIQELFRLNKDRLKSWDNPSLQEAIQLLNQAGVIAQEDGEKFYTVSVIRQNAVHTVQGISRESAELAYDLLLQAIEKYFGKISINRSHRKA